MVALGSVSGCVVTDPIDFDPPVNNPPQFVLDRGAPLQPGSIKYVSREGTEPTVTFNFQIRERDVEQDLEVHWRIYSGSTPGDRKLTLLLPAPGAGKLLRDLSIPVNRVDLENDTCHRVDIAVSASFTRFDDGTEDLSPATFDLRSDRFDYDQFTFWIWEGSPTDNEPTKLVDTCGAQPFVPVATGVGGAAGTEALP